MLQISPRPLAGTWAEGLALDYHTISSEFIGYDEYGHPQFDTKRTPMGESLYQLKYRTDKNMLGIVADTAASFVLAKQWRIEVVVPVPPSRHRAFQLVPAVAREVARRLRVTSCLDCVVKTRGTEESKNLFDRETRDAALANAFAVRGDPMESRVVLLVDDLYRSGATLNAVVGTIQAQARPATVYVLVLTATRSFR